MQKIERLLELIDHINEIIGKCFSYSIVPVCFIITYEVGARYIFNSPTIWSWDVAVYINGSAVILGAGYAQLKSAHVAVDIFVTNLSRRKKAALDFFIAFLFIFAITVMLQQGAKQAWHSILINEHKTSLLSPPVWPLRIAIPVGAFFLLLQILAKCVRDFLVAFLRRNE